jgi:membrane protein YqaA with SNARE-associated domain
MAGNEKEEKKGFILFRPIKWLYEWVMHWADTPYAAPMLGFLSFIESSFFPIPPDVLLIPMGVSRPDKAIRFAAITWIASVLGGILGYCIGLFLFDRVGIKIIEFYGVMDKYFLFREWFDKYNFLIIMVAGMTPLPYKVFTITAGVARVNFPVFLLGSIMSRGIRFMAEGIVCKYGEKYSQKYLNMSIRDFLDKYIEWFMGLMAVLGVAGFLLVKVVLPHGDVNIQQSVTLPGNKTAQIEFKGIESEENKHEFNYELTISMDGSTTKTVVPDGPFLKPSRGDASVTDIKINDRKELLAILFYSELPENFHGTNGHILIYDIEDGKPRLLEKIDFARYRLNDGGAWQEGTIKIRTENFDKDKDLEIFVDIKEISHSSEQDGEKKVTDKNLIYKLVKNKLLKIGEGKPRPKSIEDK